MAPRRNDEWLRTAEGQCGLISLEQLIASGKSHSAVMRMVTNGRLKRILSRVYAVAGSGASDERNLWAAHLYFGDSSALSHVTSAWNWGFDGFSPRPIHVSTMNKRNSSGLTLPDGTTIIVHRVDRYLASEIVKVKGLQTTSVRRTVLELCGCKHRRAPRVVDAALRKELTTVGDLWLYLEQEWMRGRRGVRIMRDLLVERTPGRVPSDSELELDLRDLIDAEGLPPPHHQFPVELPFDTVHIDIAYPEAMLAIECDSSTWHLDAESANRDKERDIELQALGWTVYRFTWAMIRFEPQRVVAAIRRHLIKHGIEC